MVNLTTCEQAKVLIAESLMDKIRQDALAENPHLEAISFTDLQLVIRKGLEEMVRLEQIALWHKRCNLPMTYEVARRIKAVIVVSGPGTWYQARKEDRYKEKAWAAWMDHARLAHGVWLIRRVTEISTGKRFQGAIDTLDERVQLIKDAIAKHGPYFIYTGREDERAAVKQALADPRSVIPSEKIYIIEEKIDNTVDQVKTLRLPPNLEMHSQDRVAVVAHSPQLVRMGHMLEQYHPLSPNVGIQPFPLPIPKGGIPEYPEQEIRGLLYYTFIGRDAAKAPSPSLFD